MTTEFTNISTTTTETTKVGFKNLNVFSLIVVGAVVLLVLIILTRILEKALTTDQTHDIHNSMKKDSIQGSLNKTKMSGVKQSNVLVDQNAKNLKLNDPLGAVASQIAAGGGLPFMTNSMNAQLGGVGLFNQQQQQLLQAGMNPMMFPQNNLFGLPGMMGGIGGIGGLQGMGMGMGIGGLGGMNAINNQASINQIKSENAANFPEPRLAKNQEQDSQDDNSAKKRKAVKKSKLVKLKKLDMILNKAIKPHANRITRGNRQHGGIRGDPKLLSNEKNNERFMRKILVLVKNEYRGGLMLAEGNKIPNAYLREPDDRMDELVEKGAILVDKFVNRYDEIEPGDISLCSLNSEDSDSDGSVSDDSYSMSTADVGIRIPESGGLAVPVLPRRDAPPSGGGLAVPILPRRNPGDPPPPRTNPPPGPPPPPLMPTVVKPDPVEESPTSLFGMGMNFLSIGEQQKSEVVPPHVNSPEPAKAPTLSVPTPAPKLEETTSKPLKASSSAGDKKPAATLPSVEPPKNTTSGKHVQSTKLDKDKASTKTDPKTSLKLSQTKKISKSDTKSQKLAKEAAVVVAVGPSESEKLRIKEKQDAEAAILTIQNEQVIDNFHRQNPEVLVFLEKCLKNSKNALKLQDDFKLKKSIDRDDGAQKPKKKMKRGHKANELSNELVLSEICYDDTFMQEVSINIIPPSSTELPIDTEEDDFSKRKPKNRLLPKKMKNRKRA